MNYIVFDLEWNSPEEAAGRSYSPEVPEYEIVEIGAVKLNNTFETVSEFKILIKPCFYPKMHRRLASLTGIRDRDLQEQGKPFPEAMETFLDWCGEECMFLTWSESDVPALAENMRVHGMDAERLPDVVDVQRIFDREIMRSRQSTSLEKAMQVLGEQGDRAHDALHDAINTVKVCGHMDLDACLDEYISHYYPCETVVKPYSQPRDILADEAHRLVRCPWCGGEMTAEDWVPSPHRKQMTMAICPEGDEFLLYLSWRRLDSGAFVVERSLYEMSDDYWEQYCDAKDAR